MRTRILLPLILAFAVLAPSCTLIHRQVVPYVHRQVVPYGTATESYQVEAPAPTPDDWGEFDCDLSDDEGPQPYYHPNYTGHITESVEGELWVVGVGGDQRSCDMDQGQATLKVTLGDQVICENDLWLLVGQCNIVAADLGGFDALNVNAYVFYREGTVHVLEATIGR